VDIEETIKQIVADQLGIKPEEVTPEADFENDLGAGSLETVELVMAFEEKFGFEIPDEEAERMRKVKDVIEYVKANAKGNFN
jgi:acyl carrier protein